MSEEYNLSQIIEQVSWDSIVYAARILAREPYHNTEQFREFVANQVEMVNLLVKGGKVEGLTK